MKSYEKYEADSSPASVAARAKSAKMSRHFAEVVQLCLQKDPAKRPTAKVLLTKPFFKRAAPPASFAAELAAELPLAADGSGASELADDAAAAGAEAEATAAGGADGGKYVKGAAVRSTHELIASTLTFSTNACEQTQVQPGCMTTTSPRPAEPPQVEPRRVAATSRLWTLLLMLLRQKQRVSGASEQRACSTLLPGVSAAALVCIAGDDVFVLPLPTDRSHVQTKRKTEPTAIFWSVLRARRRVRVAVSSQWQHCCGCLLLSR